MKSFPFRQLIVPAYLFLCLIFGGSSQSVWGLLALQMLAAGLIAYSLVFPASNPAPKGRGLLALLIGLLVLLLVQLIPLPPAVWSQIPGRSLIEEGYGALGNELPWLPISVAPYATLQIFLSLLPPIAIIVAVLRLRAYRESWTAVALFAGTLAGILLGYLQISSGRLGQSTWYLYEITNFGSAVGLFANRNHMGTLLLMALPFVVALFFAGNQAADRRTTSLMIIGAAGMITILLGIAVNGSLAAVALAVPVIAASALLVPGLRRIRAFVIAAVAIALVAALIFLASSPVQPKLTGETTSSFEGRWEIWGRTWAAIESSFPLGTGLGSFEAVYATFEPAQDITRTYVNHAHNDYLQLLLEGGIPAVALAIVFFVWWLGRAGRVLATPVTNRFAGAAAIASGAVLAHSVVDYPLRTTAIAAVFGFCLAILARGRATPVEAGPPAVGDARPARHIKLG